MFLSRRPSGNNRIMFWYYKYPTQHCLPPTPPNFFIPAQLRWPCDRCLSPRPPGPPSHTNPHCISFWIFPPDVFSHTSQKIVRRWVGGGDNSQKKKKWIWGFDKMIPWCVCPDDSVRLVSSRPHSIPPLRFAVSYPPHHHHHPPTVVEKSSETQTSFRLKKKINTKGCSFSKVTQQDELLALRCIFTLRIGNKPRAERGKCHRQSWPSDSPVMWPPNCAALFPFGFCELCR